MYGIERKLQCNSSIRAQQAQTIATSASSAVRQKPSMRVLCTSTCLHEHLHCMQTPLEPTNTGTRSVRMCGCSVVLVYVRSPAAYDAIQHHDLLHQLRSLLSVYSCEHLHCIQISRFNVLCLCTYMQHASLQIKVHNHERLHCMRDLAYPCTGPVYTHAARTHTGTK